MIEKIIKKETLPEIFKRNGRNITNTQKQLSESLQY